MARRSRTTDVRLLLVTALAVLAGSDRLETRPVLRLLRRGSWEFVAITAVAFVATVAVLIAAMQSPVQTVALKKTAVVEAVENQSESGVVVCGLFRQNVIFEKTVEAVSYEHDGDALAGRTPR